MTFLLLALAALVLYVVTAISPAHGERFRRWSTPYLRRLEHKADQAPGVLGWFLKGPFWASRKSVDASTQLGQKTRENHDKNHQ